MAYRVVITPTAKCQLDRYIGYTVCELKNKQAARAIRDDAKRTKKRLLMVADLLPLCENPILAEHGYRRIWFDSHSFFMVYRIDGKNIVVDAMYHQLQDYESLFMKEKDLR